MDHKNETFEFESEAPDPDNWKFFNSITELTKTSSENILIKDSKVIYDLVLKGYKKNIQIAASHGLTQAFICIYEKDALYQDLIPIDNYIRMTNGFKDRMDEFKIQPVVERISRSLFPFTVEVNPLQQNTKIITIVVRWK